ncbi:MAG: hypothetical protein ABI629_26005 [bacterium]
MVERTPTCWRCGAALATGERIGRRYACLSCGTDLRCCRNCAFHEPTANNQCREPQAERQVDKERGNFCDWFSPAAAPAGAADPAAVAKANLAALFQKK